jgi:ABC-type uncharacterized transport system permease subunit
MGSMDKPWFAAKRYGVGSGWPIAWQGWVALGAFLAALFASLKYAPANLKMWLAFILAVAFTVIIAAKTKGGLRWRWGGED